MASTFCEITKLFLTIPPPLSFQQRTNTSNIIGDDVWRL